MKGWRILLWTRVESTTFKMETSLGIRSTRLYSLGSCWPRCWWRVEFPVPLLTLLQLQSYLVPCISVRIFIIPKLRNICCELSSLRLCIEHLPHCYSARDSYHDSRLIPDCSHWEHLSRALPTETIIYRLRTTPSDRLFEGYSEELRLVHWRLLLSGLRSVLVNTTSEIPQTKNPICV